jgi:hypothetical protein
MKKVLAVALMVGALVSGAVVLRPAHAMSSTCEDVRAEYMSLSNSLIVFSHIDCGAGVATVYLHQRPYLAAANESHVKLGAMIRADFRMVGYSVNFVIYETGETPSDM